MNNLLLALEDACRRHPLREKVLIVPTHSLGRELCEGLAMERTGWVNLRHETFAALAHKLVCDNLAENNLTLLTGSLAAAVVEEVFQELEGRNALPYFKRKGNSPGLIRAIAASLYELRLCGITGDNLAHDSFVSAEKGQDLIVLLKAYELYLSRHQYVDTPGLLSLALERLAAANHAGEEVLYLLPDFLKLYPLEKQFVCSLAAGHLLLLQAGPVYGPARPGTGFVPAAENPAVVPSTDVARLPWLYQVDQAPPPAGDGSLSYFQAYGLRNEVREILRRLRQENIPLDTVTVACASSEYVPVFYSLARRSGLGLTFANGIPGSLTGPGRVLQGLVEWLRNDYSAAVLRDLIISGDIRLANKEGEAALSPQAAGQLLRSAGIGWGRDRYSLLAEFTASLKARADLDVDGEKDRRETLLLQSRQVEELHELIQSLLESLPLPAADGNISFRDLTSSLAELLSRLARIRDEVDAAALKGLVGELVQAGQIASFNLEMDEALERAENLLKGFRAGVSGPMPGHLHLTGYEHLIWSCRPNTYVVGLDANTFPGNSRQDPVLLDTERKQLHPGLPLGADRPAVNLYIMALALISRRGRVTLSYSSFNIVENKPVYPSSILLQVHRLLKGDTFPDYTDLLQALGKPAGYCPRDGTPPLDEVEWWVGKVINRPGIRNGPAAVKAGYRGIALGHRALEARVSLEPTEYDGMIEVSAGRLDPRSNRELVMSSSKIEAMAGCPFAYFLKHVLHIYPPDEVAYDPGQWLGQLERGALLHELFYGFMKKLTERDEKPGVAAHRSMIMKMAEELIGDYKKRIPPPSDVVYNHEAREIYRCCEVFLAAEETYAAGTPVFFEVPFGLGPEAVAEAGCGLAGPVRIDLGGGKAFNLVGKIDRIDRVGDGVYHIWDYKTGSTYGYHDHKHLCGGRQVQHALYAIAAEQVLQGLVPGETPLVEVSGYYFPTGRGEGRRVARPQSGRKAVILALSHIFDLLDNGVFIAADHGEKCNICDYPEVCGGSGAVARAKELLNAGASRLDPWRRLKELD
ncbi:MAG: PD-(D/E)XK nuclease family protein [Bacillota bacterium]